LTGHESRLNRAGVAGDRLAAFGSADYSREELIADMGSAFLCAEAGIEKRKAEHDGFCDVP
jgi:antirestriction protein ArdC